MVYGLSQLFLCHGKQPDNRWNETKRHTFTPHYQTTYWRAVLLVLRGLRKSLSVRNPSSSPPHPHPEASNFFPLFSTASYMHKTTAGLVYLTTLRNGCNYSRWKGHVFQGETFEFVLYDEVALNANFPWQGNTTSDFSPRIGSVIG